MSVHSVKGGVGKSTLAWLIAQRLAKRGPTLLVDLDLTGTSLADVLKLCAPNCGSPESLDLSRPPSGFLSVTETRILRDSRDNAPGFGSWGVPFLNDFLLAAPESPVHPACLGWEPEGVEHLLVSPSSALPRDLHAILPIIYDELQAGFLEGRVEWLLDAILAHSPVRNLVFDAPPTIPGLSAALLSMAMRLPNRTHLVPDEAHLSPPRLFDPGTRVRWSPLLVVSPDHQDLRAAERWLVGKPEEELARLYTVVNGWDDADEAVFLRRLRWALLEGEETDFPGDPPYEGPLLAAGRLTLLRRHGDLRHWRPGRDSRAEPEGFDSLMAHIEGISVE